MINVVLDQGFALNGPQIRDGAIVFAPLKQCDELPQGIEDQQSPGSYRLNKTSRKLWFSWANGPQAIKPMLFKPRELLWQVNRDSEGKLVFEKKQSREKPMALLGVRSCDLAALKLQDQHFIQGQYADEAYGQRREAMLLLAVDCHRSAQTCFCASSGDGPGVKTGADVHLRELDNGFLVAAFSPKGQKIVDGLSLKPVQEEQMQIAQDRVEAAAQSQIRFLKDPGDKLDTALLDSPFWEKIAGQCLSCGNCTSVCPSCFCFETLDDHDQALNQSSFYRQWSSCFTMDHSYMHGLNTRPGTRLQYRQWFLHKLVTWKQQYGRSGCVGCGRCITWCPAGIDITQSAAELHNV